MTVELQLLSCPRSFSSNYLHFRGCLITRKHQLYVHCCNPCSIATYTKVKKHLFCLFDCDLLRWSPGWWWLTNRLVTSITFLSAGGQFLHLRGERQLWGVTLRIIPKTRNTFVWIMMVPKSYPITISHLPYSDQQIPIKFHYTDKIDYKTFSHLCCEISHKSCCFFYPTSLSS